MIHNLIKAELIKFKPSNLIGYVLLICTYTLYALDLLLPTEQSHLTSVIISIPSSTLTSKVFLSDWSSLLLTVGVFLLCSTILDDERRAGNFLRMKMCGLPLTYILFAKYLVVIASYLVLTVVLFIMYVGSFILFSVINHVEINSLIGIEAVFDFLYFVLVSISLLNIGFLVSLATDTIFKAIAVGILLTVIGITLNYLDLGLHTPFTFTAHVFSLKNHFESDLQIAETAMSYTYIAHLVTSYILLILFIQFKQYKNTHI